MENAVEALKMAGSVLLFVLALSIAMLVFTQARETIDILIRNTDREALIDSIDTSTEEGRRLQGEFYYVAAPNQAIRNVGLETVIPSLYRAYTESYTVAFNFPAADNYCLFEFKPKGSATWEPIYSIDTPGIGDGVGNTDDLLKGILYRTHDINAGNLGTEGTRREPANHLNQPLYEYLKDKLDHGGSISEQLGTYYIDDTLAGRDEDNPFDYTQPHPADPSDDLVNVNKTKRRIITYTVSS